MPIYEFYCTQCHTIFNFLARKPGPERVPVCPRCQRPKLERRLSRFAVSKGRPEPAGGDDLPADVDEARMEAVLADMERAGGSLDEDDPRQMAQMMRKLSEATGLRLGAHMQEAIRRMEAGEDPDQIEAEMGDVLETEEPEFGAGGRNLRQWSRRWKPPEVDDTLYDL